MDVNYYLAGIRVGVKANGGQCRDHRPCHQQIPDGPHRSAIVRHFACGTTTTAAKVILGRFLHHIDDVLGATDIRDQQGEEGVEGITLHHLAS